MQNYVVYHLHSDLSNGVTNIDSVTKFGQYVDRAKELGMTALGFAEHGSIFEWYHKKQAIEAAGMKYIHGCETYVTESLDEKVRDNYHCVLIARNYDGFLELNKLITTSFNRDDNHFYYVPRISFDELCQTSDNIIITSACVGGIFGKADEKLQNRFLDYMLANKNRCFLEIGHHPDSKQVDYNRKLSELSAKTGIRLVAGTDTHALNREHERGRSILQKAKKIHFDGEDGWDLKFKTFDELNDAFYVQGAVPARTYQEAIENTNVLADMIEPFELDTNTKYPKIYDNPEKVFYDKVKKAEMEHPYALKNHSKEELDEVIDKEFAAYKAAGAIDFMLLQTYLREWEKKQGIQCGYGRGSVSGSMIAYLLGITQMDSLKFGLNFFRFMNPERVTNADIDTDYSGEDREIVRQFLLRDKAGLSTIHSAEIITFNTIADKGAIRDVGRALEIPLSEVDAICKECEDEIPDKMREKYPELFEYVDIVNGTIVSIGTHPSGILLSDLDVEQTVGLCSISTSEYPVSMLNMKELDALMYVKLDILGLDSLGVINDTCKMLGIERLTPDNVDLEDEEVWKSMREDTTLIFQWEKNSARAYLKRFMSDTTLAKAKQEIKDFSTIKWLSLGNGLLRPACASFRDEVAEGVFYDNDFPELNEFLAKDAGRFVMQETIMQFLVKFCGYTETESDVVRAAIAKKRGTETLLPEIKQRFIDHAPQHYDITKEKCETIIEPLLQIILDASSYAFSWNHSDSYSSVGYICGYLRYYYPYEFLTAALNIFSGDMEKTSNITKYAQKRGISVSMPKWGISGKDYTFDKDKHLIAKGLSSIKYISSGVSDELAELSQEYKTKPKGRFTDLLMDLDNTSINSRQLITLVKIDFFSDFGNQREIYNIYSHFDELFKKGKAKLIRKDKVEGTPLEPIIKKYAQESEKNYKMIDTISAMYEAEDMVMNLHMNDVDDITKMRNFIDTMGYAGYTSGKEEDRRKLYILDVRPLYRKKDKKKFGYSVLTKSIGSGKETWFTVMNKVYEATPVKKGSVIICLSWERDRGYFRMTNYKMIG